MGTGGQPQGWQAWRQPQTRRGQRADVPSPGFWTGVAELKNQAKYSIPGGPFLPGGSRPSTGTACYTIPRHYAG
jgi:hypothetical protein